MYFLAQRKDGESMFEKREFERLRKESIELNPGLWGSPVEIRKKMDAHKEAITSMLLNEAVELGEVGRFMPALNFMAHLLGESEYFFDWAEPEKKEPFLSNPKIGKHIAIYTPKGKDSTLGLALHSNFKIQTERVDYEFYSDIGELLQHIKEGWIYGIISLQKEEDSVEASLRHRLKNEPGWDYSSAQTYLLPPCFDIKPPYLTSEILGIMFKLAQGGYEPNSYGENFSLEEALPHLLAHMNVPVSRKVKIAVMDDEPKAVMGIITILQAWPEVELLFANQDRESEEPFHLPADSDIILLDEDMGKTRGSQVARKMEAEENFSGVIASISGEKPEHFPAELHFQLKTIIEKHYEAAKDFVHFINRLLVKAGI